MEKQIMYKVEEWINGIRREKQILDADILANYLRRYSDRIKRNNGYLFKAVNIDTHKIVIERLYKWVVYTCIKKI